MFFYLVYDQALKFSGVDIFGLTSASPPFHQGSTHVVAELPTLGIMTDQSLATITAFGYATQEKVACGSPGMKVRRGPGLKQRLYLVKFVPGDDSLPMPNGRPELFSKCLTSFAKIDTASHVGFFSYYCLTDRARPIDGILA
jgi:hypothetical protein